MLRSSVFGIALTLAASPTQTAEPIRIDLPKGVISASCAIRRQEAITGQHLGRDLRLSCPAGVETLSCEFQGGEPIDARLADVCAKRTVDIRAAQRAFVHSPHPVTLTIQWLLFDPLARKGVPIVATRRIDVVGQGEVAVANDPSRFVRFARAGVSPVTVRAGELLTRERFTLPDPSPGGELIARIAKAEITAVSYELRGPLTETLSSDGDVIVRRGLKAGEYYVVPIYEGGVEGRRRTVPIANEESTPFYIMPENVGAVEISADRRVCAEAAVVELTRSERSATPAGVAVANQSVVRVPVTGGCSQRIAGLPPSEYDAVYRSPTGVVARGSFAVASQKTTTLTLAATTARVHGFVEVNGRPREGLTVSFEGPSSDGRVEKVSAETDRAGAYEVTVPRAGTFQVVFRSRGQVLLGSERQLSVQHDDTRADWSLEGGGLKVGLVGWDGVQPVAITAKPVVMTKPGYAGAQVRISGGDTLPVAFEGLAYGQYLVDARERAASPDASDRIGGGMITIDKEHPEPSINLELRSSSTTMTVRLPNGEPASNAIVRVNGGPSLKEIDAGQFSLVNVTPGSHLIVFAAGLSPVCKLAPAGSDVDVRLEVGLAVRLRFAGRTDVAAPVGRLVWPESECPIGLSSFGYQLSSRGSDGTTEFLVADFPRSPRVTYIERAFDGPAQWQTLAIGEESRIDVRLRRDQ